MKRLISPSAMLVAMMFLLTVATPACADTVRPAAIAQAGTTATLTLALINETSSPHSYDLTATGLPAGMSATFTQAGPVMTSVKVGAHASAPVTLQLQVPADARLGRADITFVARRDDGASVEAPFTLDVESTYALKITSASKNVSTFSGQDFALDVAVVNSGAADATNLKPSLDMPPKWVLVADPPSIPSLGPGKEAVFHLKVTVPASQVAIDQPVKVSVGSDHVSSPSSPVSVRVQNNPVYLPIAGGVVLIALVALVVYFRRKGRR
ncbi:MAG: COG1470 family protein [Coriobacteriia bacterium]